jgi:hypothetical protein
MSQKVASQYKAYMLLELTVDKLKGTGEICHRINDIRASADNNPLTRFGDYHEAPSKQGH